MGKIKKQDVNHYVGLVNEQFKKLGSLETWELNSRYGYYAIDSNNGSTTVRTGLKLKEAYDIVVATFEALYSVPKI